MSADGAPLVSIIVPVFNGERFLRESLDSILAQTHRPLEVLVMDDASIDGTQQVAASYGERIRYYRQPENRGIYGNVNDGIAMVHGEYIAAYHADDVYDPTIVEREVAFLEKYASAGAVFTALTFIDPAGHDVSNVVLPTEVRGGRPLDFPVIFNALLTHKNRFLLCPSGMVRASVYRDVGVYRDAEFRNTSDLEMWLRIAKSYPIGILEEPLLRYRFGHGNSAQRYHHLRTDPERFFIIMDKYLDEGARTVATADALADYEAHRAEDRIMRSINHYIRGQREGGKAVLKDVRASHILGSPRVQRARLLVLLVALRLLLRIPRIPFVADLFYRRWQSVERKLRNTVKYACVAL